MNCKRIAELVAERKMTMFIAAGTCCSIKPQAEILNGIFSLCDYTQKYSDNLKFKFESTSGYGLLDSYQRRSSFGSIQEDRRPTQSEQFHFLWNSSTKIGTVSQFV